MAEYTPKTIYELIQEIDEGRVILPAMQRNFVWSEDKICSLFESIMRDYRRTFHSDQGWAYQMKAYSHRLKEERIFQSMSRKGNCLDNSVMENFFGLLKQEIYYGVVYYSYEELKSEIERFIKYYNEKRIKEKLGWMSPVQYRLHLLAA